MVEIFFMFIELFQLYSITNGLNVGFAVLLLSLPSPNISESHFPYLILSEWIVKSHE